VRGWDPVALEEARAMMPSVQVTEPARGDQGRGCRVIVTEWKELHDLLTPEARGSCGQPLIVDGRNLLDPAEARAAGFVYESIGRAAHDLDALPETEEPETQLHQ
jgi:UDPglucose 6-dehydrogenase